jgi:hypothetical protein
VALAAILVAQDGRGGALFGRRHQRGGLRLDDGQRIALGALLAFAAFRAVFAVTTVLEALAAVFALGARTIVTLPVVTLPVFAWAFITRAIVTRPVVAGAILALTVVAVAPTVAVAVATLGALAALAVIAVAVVALTVLTLVPLAIPAFGAGLFAAFAFGRLTFGVGRGLGRFGGRRLSAALVLEVDVEAAGEVVAAKNFGRRLGRLHGAHDPEIVLGVLQVVFSQNAVAGGRRVAGELLVLFENVLGVAAHLHAVRAVGIERPVRVLLLRLAAAAAAIAAALALHTLEISHSSYPPPLRSFAEVCAAYPLALVGRFARKSVLKT